VNAELSSALVPILFYAICRGARAIAGKEESGTLDVLLVTP
jgi:ABC-2 type transport system permease protein